MRPPLSRAWALTAAALVAILAASVLDRFAPFPTAEVSRGSEEAFATGLHRRELPPGQPPQRWTTDRSRVRFRDLPPGPAKLLVRVHGHRAPVTVASDGVLLGVLTPGAVSAEFPLSIRRSGTAEVELHTEGFLASDGRRLGALLDQVAVVPAMAGLASLALTLGFLVPALFIAFAGLTAGVPAGAAVLIATAVTLLEAALLWPSGLVRSDYAQVLPRLLVIAGVLALVFGRLLGRRHAGAAPWAFTALLLAILVQGVAATWPSMVVSDAVFHAHKLEAVARGDFFPTSLTQHARPFRFPYGVSFYALLAPLARAGLDEVVLVRWGAALSAVAASAGLFWLLLPRGASLSALAVMLLQLMPVTFEEYSFGNLSNVFGQAVTVLFLAWWVRGGPGSWPLGALLLALAALGHFSSLAVLLVLVACLAFLEGRGLVGDRRRALALGIGLGLVFLYYVRFTGMVLEQLPRLLEGGGQGRGASRTAADALRQQVLGAWGKWGWPAILLALWWRPRPRQEGLDRATVAFWLAGAILFVPAVASPLDVRYLYALTLPLAVAGGAGAAVLASKGAAGRAAVWLLLAYQGLLGTRNMAEALLFRYRP